MFACTSDFGLCGVANDVNFGWITTFNFLITVLFTALPLSFRIVCPASYRLTGDGTVNGERWRRYRFTSSDRMVGKVGESSYLPSLFI
jgi:hypothetical protein